MSILHDVAAMGQSIWLDTMRRSMIESGELRELIGLGVRGITSNPTIFEKAIAGSADYDAAIRELAAAGKEPAEIVEALILEDIARAADLLRPIYEETNGADGFVSIEVHPRRARDTEGTVEEARRLFAAIGRPNVMIKVPATPEGMPAIETLLAEGIHVNITLIFSLAQYEAVAEAYLRAMERRAVQGGSLDVASVASYFVSRLDAAVDAELENAGRPDLQGKAAIAAARRVYGRFRELFAGARWDALAGRGARLQRPLWASTSVKNPHYPDTLYVKALIGPDTVNTLPLHTLRAFLDHGRAEPALDEVAIAEAEQTLRAVAEAGVDLESITARLLAEGLEAFAASYEALVHSVAQKVRELRCETRRHELFAGAIEDAVRQQMAHLQTNRIIPRIWKHDYTVWKPAPDEIANRLGWLHIVEPMAEEVNALRAFADEVRADGYTHALLLGMGGSSLAPEVFRKTLGVKEGYLDLAVLDSTAPEAVLWYAENWDLEHTLFIVSTKSGTTVETLSFMNYFYNGLLARMSPAEAGAHFIAITDPGSPLVRSAEELGFRRIFLNDPNIGGRYSALSYFGLVPVALIGADPGLLLDRAATVMQACESCVPGENNPACVLGALMGGAALAGRDKLTLVGSPALSSFGGWAEQLVAESTGKEGRGILPVVDEPLGDASDYGEDRVFVYIQLEGEMGGDLRERVAALGAAGHPVLTLTLRDVYDLGGQMFLWEMGTAVAGHILGINPFDQPNVEAAKKVARQMLRAYQETGMLPQPEPVLVDGDMRLFGEEAASGPAQTLCAFLAPAEPGAYVAVQAYLPPTPAADQALRDLRRRLRDFTGLPVTVGYGPRYLHSTGQLHKGDAGKGLFLQLTCEPARDVPIPDAPGTPHSSATFGTLCLAQALGDNQALREAGRKVLRVHLMGDVGAGIGRLAAGLTSQ